MVGGAHGQAGHRALQHVVVVRGPDNVPATILMELTVLAGTCGRRPVTLKIVQVK